jgi:hypothetical protein
VLWGTVEDVIEVGASRLFSAGEIPPRSLPLREHVR